MADSDGIVGALKARLSSEILGTFSLSLILCSWKIWIYAFSSESADLKIAQIDDFLYSRQFLQAIGEAFVATLLILFLLPKFKTSYLIWLLKDTTKFKISERKAAVAYVVQTRDFSSKIKSVHNLNVRVSNAKKSLTDIASDLSRISQEIRGDSEYKKSLDRRVGMLLDQSEDMNRWIERLNNFESVATELGLKLDEIANDAESKTV